MSDAVDASPHLRPPLYLTAAVPGTGGVLRARPEDFIVEEIPAYDPCGEGEHLYLFVQKVNLSTLQMVEIVARHFGVRTSDVGYAGLKDKRAVTRQVLSVHAPGRRLEDFPELRHDRLAVLWTDQHTNKLRRGHLKGNRFAIKIRGVELRAVFAAKASLQILARQGVPNRAGEQRFGYLHNNHVVGRAILLGRHAEALEEMLSPEVYLRAAGPVRDGHQVEARALYREGRFAEAARLMPRGSASERNVLLALSRGADARRAVLAAGQVQRSFYLTAWQSAVFNAVLDRRLTEGAFAALLDGDLAFRHDNHAVFAVDDAVLADAETARRLGAVEISPSGPMWGASMLEAKGRAAAVETEALAHAGVGREDLAAYAASPDGRDAPLEGKRRPLRVPLAYPDVEAGRDEHGLYVKCAFELPSGAFATSVMQEIIKAPGDLDAPPDADAPPPAEPPA